MTRRTKIASLAIVFSVLAVICYYVFWNDEKPRQQSPLEFNIFIVVSDALRYDVLGCYGGQARTPNLDWLAENGILFENAYCTSPWTAPSCVSMFTGNYATAYDYAEEKSNKAVKPVIVNVPESRTLLAEVMEKEGYMTWMQIENLNASIHNNLQGFEPIPPDELPQQDIDNISRIVGGEMRNNVDYKKTYQVLKHLLESPAGETFFLVHWIMDPHYPYFPVDKFESQIEVDESELPKGKVWYQRGMRGSDKWFTLSPDQKKYVQDLYLAEVESVDERVGYILEMLKHKKLLTKTIIIFTSDHGEQFGDHGLWGHGQHYYEGMMRVPLIYTGPDLPRGRRVKAAVSHLDLMPTVKDLSGIDYNYLTQGQSYLKLLRGKSSWNRTLFFDDIKNHKQIDALIEKNYKLITQVENKFELYDIHKDPGETNNLESRYPEKVNAMLEKIMAIRQENLNRQKENRAALDDNIDGLSDSERKKVIDRLRALGYIQ